MGVGQGDGLGDGLGDGEGKGIGERGDGDGTGRWHRTANPCACTSRSMRGLYMTEL